jgi:hypothetical protein
MTDWDERAEKVKGDLGRQEAAAAEERAAVQRARIAEQEEIWSKLKDIAGWAIQRYQTAHMQPLPIYAAWTERVKPFLGKSRRESRRVQVGAAYPLLQFTRRFDDDYGVTYDHRMILVAPDRKIFDVSVPAGEAKSDAADVKDVVYWVESDASKRPPLALETFVKPIALGYETSNWLNQIPIRTGQSGAVRVNDVCDQIAAYVASRAGEG